MTAKTTEGYIDFDHEWRELRRNVGEAANGRWPDLIESLAPQLRPLVDEWKKRPMHAKPVPCPICNTSEMRAFRMFAQAGYVNCNACGRFNGFELLHRYLGMTFGEICIELAMILRVDSILVDMANGAHKQRAERPARVIETYTGPSEDDIIIADAKKSLRMAKAWNESVSLNAPEAAPARLYLARRGLLGVGYGIAPLQGDVLRMHPGMEFWEAEEQADGTTKGVCRGRFPAILAATSYPNGTKVAIQRHYITTEGHKAPFETTKMMMPTLETRSPSGASTQFDKPGLVMAVGEGLETMLAGRLLSGLPTWAMHSATFLESALMPEECRYVIVFADKDRSRRGEEAAVNLIARMRAEGRKAVAYIPPMEIPEGKKGVDWNDVLLADGIEKARGMEFLNAQLKRLRELLIADGHSKVADEIGQEQAARCAAM